MKLLYLALFLMAIPAAQALMIEIPKYTGDNDPQPVEEKDNRNMVTPSCETFPEWTGSNVEDVDLSVLEDRPHRVLKPDSMATMDYRPNRLNIKTNEDGIILDQECG